MFRRFTNVAVASFVVLAAVSLFGCGQPETKLTKQEEKNFKGSSEMSEEAKKRMAEGMKRMAEIQKSNGKGFQPGPASGG
jgi:hypothetical protein